MNRAFIYNDLLLKSFAKAESLLGTDKVTQISKFLSEYIEEVSKTPYGERSLRENLKKIKSDPKSAIAFQPFVADALSQYLGKKDFNEFAQSFKIEEQNQNKSFRLSKNAGILAITIFALIILYVVYSSINIQRWMLLQNDQYVEVAFDAKLLEEGKLKLYKEERIEKFKKINPSCDALFFDEQGKVKLWYGKNANKEFEYFTDLGLHPETGVTLKPITKYIIDKYLCE